MKLASLFVAAGLAVGLALLQAPARAQDSSKYFTVMHPGQFVIDWGAVYREAEKRTTQTRAELPHYLDLPYGEDPKQKLDLYLPKGKVSRAPVFLFLHGGGFREGDRAQYGYIASSFAKHGIITAVASYRLTGDGFKFPDQPQDAQLAVKWLYTHVRKYGGNPRRLYVGGHSAGAVLSAEIFVDRSWMTALHIPKGAVHGMVPVSGKYDLRTPGRPGEGDTFAPTPELQAQASAVLHIVDPVPAAVVALGSTEKPLVPDSTEFARKLREAGSNTQLLVIDGFDHKDTVKTLADDQGQLFKAILAMIESTP
jgi:acetyl esterase/lipase